MADLSKVLPEDSATVRAIYDWWKQQGDSQPKRGYLGGSIIGTDCERQLWYQFRECSFEDFSGRLYRLFDRGHKEEFRFVEELKGIGCEVHEVGPDGKQFGVIAHGGHFRGHADGVALGVPEAPKTWHLLEMKTSSAKAFRKLQREGVEKAKPQHFAQMQVYMHLMKLTRALYIVVNKDSDELYSERIKHDSKRAEALLEKAGRVIYSTTPPERISDKPEAFACKWCPAKALCHGSEDALPIARISCRQCCHATPETDGTWSCAKGKEFGTPCDMHLTLPGLLPWSEATDSATNKDGSDVIEFTTEDGTVWVHGNNPDLGQYSTEHLTNLTKDLVSAPSTKIKEKGLMQPDLKEKYNLTVDGIESVWKGHANDISKEWSRFIDYPMSNPISEQNGPGWVAADFGSACAVIYSDGKAEIRVDKNQ